MIDPFLDNPTFNGDKQAAAKGATHVVVTHGHDDHVGSAVEICKATGAVLVANPEVSDYLVGAGRSGEPQRADQPRRRARSRRLQHRLCAGLALVLDHHRRQAGLSRQSRRGGDPGGGERTLLHMGDTGIFDGMKLIGEIYAPKIGIVPIGDRFTMGPKLAALACRRYFDFETVIPCHYETFGALHGKVEHFVKEMEGSGTEVLVPKRGEPVTL